MAASKDRSGKGAKALDYVETQQQAKAELSQQEAGAQAQKAARPREGADPTHDSPKRQGDKLEKARDAAAGRSKGG